MQAVLNPEASFVLIAAAARIGHCMGLHRWLDGFGLSQSELEQRRRVFWVIYILEKSTCLRIGRPSAINDEDIGVPLPPEDLHDEGSLGIHVASTPGRIFYPFRAACAIALIESKVYSELYSARSWTQMPDERLNRVSRLDQELQEWKDNIPLEIRPEHTIQCEGEHRFAIIMLHFGYYNCLTTIHRVSIHHRSWISKDGDAGSDATPPQSSPTSSTSSPLNPRVYASYALCLSAARSTIHIATHLLGSGDDPRN
jgi:Fungal specific transcription factor domain